MTQVVYISGVHGVGKTTIIQKLAKRLEHAGMSVYVFPEMSYIPQIDIGTLEFQLWFRKQILIREMCIDAIIESGIVDYIILDRQELDIDIYTQRLIGESMFNIDYEIREGAKHFIIDCDAEVIAERLQKRVTEEEWRENWGEDDMEYMKWIIEAFRKNALKYPIELTIVENTEVEKAIKDILEWLY